MNTHLLHFKYEFIDCPCFWGKFPAIPDGHRPCNIGCITVPLTPSIDEQDLRVQLLGLPLRELVLVVVIVGFDGSPSEFAVVAAIM
jgi:hypothetical protein